MGRTRRCQRKGRGKLLIVAEVCGGEPRIPRIGAEEVAVELQGARAARADDQDRPAVADERPDVFRRFAGQAGDVVEHDELELAERLARDRVGRDHGGVDAGSIRAAHFPAGIQHVAQDRGAVDGGALWLLDLRCRLAEAGERLVHRRLLAGAAHDQHAAAFRHV